MPAIAAAVGFGAIAVFQIALAAGAPLARAAWGGTHAGQLPVGLRVGSAIAVGVWALAALIVLRRGRRHIHPVPADGAPVGHHVLTYLAELVDDPPDGFERVTIRQLLDHTAGLGMTVGVAGEVNTHHTEDTLQRRAVDILQHPLAFEPGERFGYSNAGPTLLAAVVEQVTGSPFADVLTDRILQPLPMTDTFASATHPAHERLATGHRLCFGSWRPTELPYDPAGVAIGYLGSNARDLASFLHAHLDDPDAAGLVVPAAEIIERDAVPTGWDEALEAHHGLG